MSKKMNVYRWIRIVLAFFSLTACMGAVWFFKGGEKIFLSQAGSDVLKVIAGASAGVILALSSIVLATLLFGRIYCSVVCPLGILQDAMGSFRRRAFKRDKFQRKIRYCVLAFTVVCALCGLMLPLTLLVPSSSFVLIVNNVFREVVQYADKVVHFLSEPVTVRGALGSVILSWAIFAGLLVLVRWKGRIYCNTLCPVGAVLGLLSRRPLFRIRIDEEKCVHCGACERVCKGACIDAAAGKVDTEECVVCMNCLSACKLGAIAFSGKRSAVSSAQKDVKEDVKDVKDVGKEEKNTAEVSSGPLVSRRAFLGILGSAAGGAVMGSAVRHLTGSKEHSVLVPMPPGAGDLDSFNRKCLGCGLCIGSCEGKVLKQSTTQYGWKGFMQPYMDMASGACKYECRKCQEVCPCGALTLMDLAKKQTCRVGLAKYTKERCVSFLKNMDCGACSEHCPVGAINMVTYKDTLIPEVNEKLCIGCGACQNICPVRPLQAILVHGVSTQVFVEKPKKEKQTKLASEDDFPF